MFFIRERRYSQSTFKLVGSVLLSLDIDEYCSIVFLDFSKVFETVSHNLLLFKLEKI